VNYWTLVKTMKAEVRALQLLDSGCLANIGVMIEPTVGASKLARHDEMTRRLEAASSATIHGASKFRPPALGDMLPRPKRFALDCAPISRRFRVDTEAILRRVLPEVVDGGMEVMAVIDIEALARMNPSEAAFQHHLGGFALKLRRGDLRRQDLIRQAKALFDRFAGLGDLSLYVDAGFIDSENFVTLHETLLRTIPELAKATEWSRIIVGAYSCPNSKMLPKAGDEATFDRSDLRLIQSLEGHLPIFEYCDRGIVDAFFQPKKRDERTHVRHPPYMTVTTKKHFRSARESRNDENYAAPMGKLSQRLVVEHQDEFFRCKPLKELIDVGQKTAMIRTRGDRISRCLALHINQTFLSVRQRGGGTITRPT
jgi:Beta protein